MREDDELQDDDEQRGDSVREPSPPAPRKRTSDHGVETQKDKGTEPDGSKHRHGKRRRLAMDAVEIPVIVRRDKANGKAREDKGKGKGKEVEDSQHDVDMENESVFSFLFSLCPPFFRNAPMLTVPFSPAIYPLSIPQRTYTKRALQTPNGPCLLLRPFLGAPRR